MFYYSTYEDVYDISYDLLSTHDATEHDDDQYAAHDKTGSQVIVVLRFRNIFIYLKEIKGPHILSILNICRTEGSISSFMGYYLFMLCLGLNKIDKVW